MHIGWPIAVAVCFLFTFVALFFSFTNSNAFRKIKNSMCKNVNSKHERHEPRDGEEELIVVRVGNRFEEKAQPNFTSKTMTEQAI